GQDAFHAIQTWKEWEKLLLLCNFVVMTRPGYENKGLEGILPASFSSRCTYDDDVKGFRGPTGHVIFFREVTFLDISSSDIRQRVRQGKSIKFLVPESIRHYIAKNSLYKNA
ncbi:MAG: nicotinate-nucleotide adenylyltransferase, partial [Deltaproteobacteria bacterium]|nr:nicotinate-nucleotide adenylyltransferase [Deltaproteobacteria bacterium]